MLDFLTSRIAALIEALGAAFHLPADASGTGLGTGWIALMTGVAVYLGLWFGVLRPDADREQAERARRDEQDRLRRI
ncbi:MAG: hypothetical protein R3D33_03480 [Hyphomicrobiaceae bacterium]